MKKIALATCRQYPELTSDEQRLTAELAALGIEASPLIWDAPENFERVKGLDAVVIRTCWDYHFKPAQFLNWIEALEQRSTLVLNAPAVIRWNFEKTYLRALETAGLGIPATVWLEGGRPADLRAILAERSWSRAVLKPTISATAWRTRLVGPDFSPEDQRHLEVMLSSGGVMVQEYLEEVAANGEWSLIFFQRRFSHAVLKRAATGDFRVQSDFGGRAEAALSPPPAALDAARTALDAVDGELLYARVDGVFVQGKFLLMELELIEPSLFLTEDPNAVKTFASAIASYF